MTDACQKKQSITLIWRIKNFSKCLHKKGELLASPRLGRNEEGIGEWKLFVYPRGKYIGDYIYVDIVRYAKEEKTLQMELSLLAIDGSSHFIKKGFYGNGLWNWSTTDYIKRELVEARKSEFLPHDTLTVQCHIWGSSIHHRESETHIALTKLVQDQEKCDSHFISSFKNFTTLQLPFTNSEKVDTIPEKTLPSTLLNQVTCVQVTFSLLRC